MSFIFTSLFEAFFAQGIQSLWQNKNLVLAYAQSMTYFRNKSIRFSISYIYRIKVPDTDYYLLVFNRRIQNQLQPPGGVYKRYGDDHLFEKWGFSPDTSNNGLGTDTTSSSDLRFRVRGKNVVSVIKWFEEEREREVGAEREFVEELLDTQILDSELFRKIKYRKLRRISKNLKWSKFHSCYEFLIYDILEFLPNIEQGRYLKNLFMKAPFDREKGYAFVTFDDICQLRYREGNIQVAKIGEHSQYIINI